MPGDEWQRFANLRLLFGMMWGQPGKKLLFMGGELATPSEWAHERSLDWGLHDAPSHAGVRRLVADLNAPYRPRARCTRGDADHDGLRGGGRRRRRPTACSPGCAAIPSARDASVLVVVNATPTVHYGYRVGVPYAGSWTEILNTDAVEYGGSGIGNLGRVTTDGQRWHGFDQSVPLTLPPLAVVFLREERV